MSYFEARYSIVEPRPSATALTYRHALVCGSRLDDGPAAQRAWMHPLGRGHASPDSKGESLLASSTFGPEDW